MTTKQAKKIHSRFWQERVCLSKAFTLIELLVVIAIISLLMSILVPVLGKARGYALQIKCAHNLKQIDLAVRAYQNQYDEKYPCANDPVSIDKKTGQKIWLWMGRGWRPFLESGLNEEAGARNASIMLCPADRTEPNKYDSTSYAYSMSFYHSAYQIDKMNGIGDQTGGNDNPFVASVPQIESFVLNPNGKIMISEWFSNHYTIEVVQKWFIWEGRRNYLFADGHVEYLPTSELRPANDGLPNPNLTNKGIAGRDWPR